jgi:hypothetical protein
MNMQIVKWCVDLAMGITLLACFITGLLKFTLIVRIMGLTRMVLPMALISDIHDWSGLALGILVVVHLFFNRVWIKTMTRKVLFGTKDIQ